MVCLKTIKKAKTIDLISELLIPTIILAEKEELRIKILKFF